MRRIRTAVGIALASALAACVAGTSVSAPGIDALQQDPCAVPSALLDGAGLTSPPYQRGPVGIEFAGWSGCIWRDGRGAQDFAVYIGAGSTETMLADPRYQDYTSVGPTEVAGMEATEIADRLDPQRSERCYAAVDLASEVVLLWTRIVPGGPGVDSEPCAEVRRIGAMILPLFSAS